MNGWDGMAKYYRTKPVTIQAVQFTGPHDFGKLVDFVGEHMFQKFIYYHDDGDVPTTSYAVWDDLHRTWITVNFFDWIIKGTRGEFYPCVHDVFETKYEEDV